MLQSKLFNVAMMPDFWVPGWILNSALLSRVLIVRHFHMPKRKRFNVANLGAWAWAEIPTKENVSNCTEILNKLLTFCRLTPLDPSRHRQHHSAQRSNARSPIHPCFQVASRP